MLELPDHHQKKLTSLSLSLYCPSGLARQSLETHHTHEQQRALLKISEKAEMSKHTITMCS